MNTSHSSRAIVDLNAYTSNLDLVKRLSGDADLIPVIKADAYGHGLVPVARAALRAGAKMLGVAMIQEGIKLRENDIRAPVLVMVSPPKKALPLFLEYKLTLTVVNKEMAQELGALAHASGQVTPVHCKIDTGMGRQGINYEEALDTLQFVSRITHLDLQGIFTHFPSADVPDDSFTHNQIKAFKQLLKQVDKAGYPYEIAHAANSAGVVNYQESVCDAVRPGLITYGIWPTEKGSSATLVKPVLRWETNIAQVRTLAADSTIGYGRTHILEKTTRTAILPVGYADGYKHQLSNKAFVLIGGKRCPVLGSVCMDQIVVNVTEVPNVAAGDVATLIGEDGNERITAEELARLAGTIPYDILTSIGARVHREYV
jgi:alanine racemase